MISLAIFGYGGYRVARHFLRPHLVFQPIWGWGDLGFFHLHQLLTRRSLKIKESNC
jgi:hypothetical protein